MRTMIYFFLPFIGISVQGQVGINTQTPEATLEVVGKPTDTNHYDGIIPPRITGNQLAAKSYSSAKKGAVVFATAPATNLSGQVIHITESGLYCFDGNVWQPLSKEKDPIEYYIQLVLDPDSTAALSPATTWSAPGNQWGNTNAYLTSFKRYNIGTKNFGGLTGVIIFRKIQGVVNVHFQMYRSSASVITGNAFINLENLYRDLGYFPNQIVLLHTENSTQHFPALLENFALQIPQTSLSAMSTSYYTYGDVDGYSYWRKPYYP